MKQPMVVDGRPLQKGFKAHRERGIGRYTKNLLTAMRASAEAPDMEMLVQGNLPLDDLPEDVPKLAAAYAPSFLPIGKRLISHHWLVRRPLAPAWRDGRVAHFFCHLDAPALLGPRTVITVHDLIAQRLEKMYRGRRSSAHFRLERWLETRSLFVAARLIAVSQQTKNDLIELYGLDPNRITVIPEAADPGLAPVDDPAQTAAIAAKYGLDPDGPFFLYLGGIDQRKGLAELLEALAGLRGQDLPHTLAIAGGIENDKQFPLLLAKIKDMGLDDSVKLLGYVPDGDLPGLFAACAAFVFPSHYEGFGLPPLEAMACGAPVIAAKASAVPEVVGEAGLLIPPGDAGALTQALAGLLTNPELAQDLRQRGFARAALFSWQRAAQSTLAVYEEVAGDD